MNERSTGATDEQAFIEAATVLTGILESYPEFDELNADSTAEVIVDDLGKRGYAIVPVSLVRADPALVEAEWLAQIVQGAVNTEIDMDEDWSGGLSMSQARTIADVVLDAIRATREPERVGE